MKLLEDRIRKDGKIKEGNVLKVDSFLNHQMDVKLFHEIGLEFKRRFEGKEINKILTIEASGIGIACVVAEVFDVPILFAKKSKSTNLGNNVYTSKVFSYTHNREYTITVSKKYITPSDKFLIVDDFMANGLAVKGLINIVKQAGAEVAGVGICIEKSYQAGGKEIRNLGYRVESLAKIQSMENGKIVFAED